jgi:hypothetical protein
MWSHGYHASCSGELNRAQRPSLVSRSNSHFEKFCSVCEIRNAGCRLTRPLFDETIEVGDEVQGSDNVLRDLHYHTPRGRGGEYGIVVIGA